MIVNLQPKQVCESCGVSANVLTCLKKYGRSPMQIKMSRSTWHMGECEICGETREVTQPRDFFYPDFALLFDKMFEV